LTWCSGRAGDVYRGVRKVTDNDRGAAHGLEKRVKTVKALLVTDKGRQPALLSADYTSSDSSAVLTVDGVAYAPEDLPKGAYLKVRSPEMADQAAVAGFFVEPPNTVLRRSYRIVGKLCAVLLLAGVPISLFWAVRSALALDLLAVLAWVGMSLFAGLLGLYWWFSGDQEMLGKLARNRRNARRFRRGLGSFLRRR
jgi:hypothetical protein